MKHLLSMHDVNADDIFNLIHRAIAFKQKKAHPQFPQQAAALLFYENSTRTVMSFLLACNHLKVVAHPLDLDQSSEQKGETLLDTVLTLHAIGFETLIIRHHQDFFYEPLLPLLPETLHLINAGDGQHEHPSQALLDIMTIYESFPEVPDLNIAILGDIRHSRVAHSFQALCKVLNITLTCIAPPAWQDEPPHTIRTTDDVKTGLKEADVVMVLRVQKERLEADKQLCLKTYHQQYGLTRETLHFAKKNAIVLHPGPMNRGIEISDEVADGPQSRILKQVNNGVWMRMAIIEKLLTT